VKVFQISLKFSTIILDRRRHIIIFKIYHFWSSLCQIWVKKFWWNL